MGGRRRRYDNSRPMSAAMRRRVRSGYYEKWSYAKRKAGRARGARRGGWRPRGKKRHAKRRYLRVLPLGQPQTKTIKLRTRIQCAMQTVQDEWIGFKFEPANFRQPFKFMKLAPVTANGMYAGADTGIWIDRNTATPAITKATLQPQGLDRYMATGAATPGLYFQSLVKGSKITITQNPNVTDDTSFKFVGGFTKLWPNDSAHGPLISRVYKNVVKAETDDMMTTGLMKHPKRFDFDPASGVAGKRWTFKYSQRQYAESIARYNPGTGAITNWFGTFDLDPVVNPSVFFILSDTSSPTAATFIQVTIVIEYVIQLRSLEAIDRSVV